MNVRRVSDRPFGAYSICNAVFYAEECFDTGPNEHVIFETLPARPLVWIVEKLPHSPGEETATKVWPGVCDEPEMYVHAPSDSCYDLIAANELGLMTRSRRICPGAAGGGCALGGAAHGSLLGPAFGLLALAGALRIRHLRRRGQRDTDQRRQRPASHP